MPLIYGMYKQTYADDIILASEQTKHRVWYSAEENLSHTAHLLALRASGPMLTPNVVTTGCYIWWESGF